MRIRIATALPFLLLAPLLSGCELFGKKAEEIVAAINNAAPSKHLYILSGSCYAGGVTTAAPTNKLYKYDVTKKQMLGAIVDFRGIAPGDSPVGITPHMTDSSMLMIGIENATQGRRIYEVNRNGSGGALWNSNQTLLGTQVRGLATTSDNGLLVARSTMIEKITPFGTRATNSAGAVFITLAAAGAAPCSLPITTVLTFAHEISNNRILIGHATNNPNNKIGVIGTNGYAVTGDCVSAAVQPTGMANTALPTAAVNLESDVVAVAYAGNNTLDNFIRVNTYNATTGALGTTTADKVFFNGAAYFRGASAMTYDSANKILYVALSPMGFETIEAFQWDSTAKTLTRIGSTPFISGNLDLSCISGLYYGD